MEKTATLVKKMDDGEELYRMNPPLLDVRAIRADKLANAGKFDADYSEGNSYEYVVVSVRDLVDISDTETFIFPGNEDGRITGWGKLPGSFRGSPSISISDALENAGYTVVA